MNPLKPFLFLLTSRILNGLFLLLLPVQLPVIVSICFCVCLLCFLFWVFVFELYCCCIEFVWIYRNYLCFKNLIWGLVFKDWIFPGHCCINKENCQFFGELLGWENGKSGQAVLAVYKVVLLLSILLCTLVFWITYVWWIRSGD